MIIICLLPSLSTFLIYFSIETEKVLYFSAFSPRFQIVAQTRLLILLLESGYHNLTLYGKLEEIC